MKRTASVVLLILLTSAVSAQVYSYRDKSGRLVLTDVPGSGRTAVRKAPVRIPDTKPGSVLPVPSRARQISQLIQQYAARFDLEEALLRAVIKTESDFDHQAVSHKGAMGLMQLMPETGEQYGVTDFFDPKENIAAGAEHLRYLLDRYFGDYEMALAAYNAGETAVEKYNGIPPYPETRNYVTKIMGMVRGRGSTGNTPKRTTIYRYTDASGRTCLTNIYPSGAADVEVVSQ